MLATWAPATAMLPLPCCLWALCRYRRRRRKARQVDLLLDGAPPLKEAALDLLASYEASLAGGYVVWMWWQGGWVAD